MGKLVILLVMLTSAFLLACASGEERNATISGGQAEDATSATSNRTFDEFNAVGPAGPAGPPGPAGPQGGFADSKAEAREFGFDQAPMPGAAMPAATPAPAAPALPQF
jgi:hypothetical protein